MNTQPRVLIDATAIPASLGGVGRYLEHLIPALAEDGARLVVVVQQRDREWIAAAAPRAEVVALPHRWAARGARLLWEQLGLPAMARRTGCEVIHSPHYTFPLLTRRPRVVTLHDATFFSDSHVHSALKVAFFRGWTRLALRFAQELLVPSAATRSELVRLVGARAARARVAYHGVDTAQFHVPTPESIHRVQELIGAPRWVAFLGTLEPRKNVPALIRAFVAAAEDRPEVLDGVHLVIAGASGWDADVDGAVALSDRVHRLGYVDKELLPALLGGADVVAYPSSAEGFGLPVLEAMACGAAVLTTRRLALPEVGGDAVEYTEPTDEAIAAALTRLLADGGRRADLGERARTRAAEFSWTRTARTHAEAYAAAGVEAKRVRA